MKIKFIISLIVILTLSSVFLLSSCFLFNPSEPVPTETKSPENQITETTVKVETDTMKTETNKDVDTSDQIVVTNPQPDQLIESPLIIEGQARGNWFFEAVFPIILLDSNGNLLARHFAQAQGEWTTEAFVPFKSQIEFEEPATDAGVLILEKDNPSGLSENDAKIEIPVRFIHPGDTNPVEGEYFTGAILKSIDTKNNKIVVEQLINDPDEIIIEPEVRLSEGYKVIRSILNIETGEEESTDMALEEIPIGSEIGILFSKDDTAKLIIYQVLIESDDK